MSGSRGDRKIEGERGDHKNTLLFIGRVFGKIWLYRERETGGGGGHTDRDGETKIVDE